MPRPAPPDRLEQLVDCATRVFVERGYRRTQMADVAEALGVAKGTLYLYVESKEALFDLAVRLADAPRPFAAPPHLPVRTPKPGATLRYVRAEIARHRLPPGPSSRRSSASSTTSWPETARGSSSSTARRATTRSSPRFGSRARGAGCSRPSPAPWTTAFAAGCFALCPTRAWRRG